MPRSLVKTVVYRGDTRVIAPTYSSSLRRTTSMTNPSEELHTYFICLSCLLVFGLDILGMAIPVNVCEAIQFL